MSERAVFTEFDKSPKPTATSGRQATFVLEQYMAAMTSFDFGGKM